MSNGKELFRYCGSVSLHGDIISHKWSGQTYAASEQQARVNLAYQFKKAVGLINAVPVKLNGKIMKVKK